MNSEQAETSAINDQTNVCPTQVGSVADSKPTKKGRKSKAEKQTDETALRWTHEMVEFLMKAKFETYKAGNLSIRQRIDGLRFRHLGGG